MTPTRLRCCGCGAAFDDDGLRLTCPHDHPPALLRSEYAERRFAPTHEPSVLRYRAWLPLQREVRTDARVAVYRSDGLARRLGLGALWIAFSGWWPERGATLPTGTFKDLEALAVLGRFPLAERRPLVVASAGNTGAAFAHACSESGTPAVVVVPADAWSGLAAAARIAPSVRVVALANAQYDDAIVFARRLVDSGEFIFEGGVRNVARRDGMGTVMLAAAEAIGHLPSAYVQAVGSAAGALAAYEASLRLIGDGRFGETLPRLVLAQNAPYTPIHDGWRQRAGNLPDVDDATARERIAALHAPVLSNRTPPYAVAGGVRHALCKSGGITFAVENEELARANALFEELEGIDLDPAAAVATAALIRAAADGTLRRDETVLLHVTGGGRRTLRPGNAAELRPALVLHANEDPDEALARVRDLVAATAC